MWFTRLVAWLLGYKYYLNQKDMMTVHRVIDNYAFSTEAEFLNEVRMKNWSAVKRVKIIWGDKKETE